MSCKNPLIPFIYHWLWYVEGLVQFWAVQNFIFCDIFVHPLLVLTFRVQPLVQIVQQWRKNMGVIDVVFKEINQSKY